MPISQFIAGLVLLFGALVAWKYATHPLALDNLPWTIGEAIGGVVGMVLWGLVIWAPIRLARGRERAPDQLRFVLYTAAIGTVAFIAYRTFVGSPLDRAQRDNLAQEIATKCYTKQRDSADNESYSDGALLEYCACYGASMARELSDEEMARITVQGGATTALIEEMERVSEMCRHRVIQNDASEAPESHHSKAQSNKMLESDA